MWEDTIYKNVVGDIVHSKKYLSNVHVCKAVYLYKLVTNSKHFTELLNHVF